MRKSAAAPELVGTVPSRRARFKAALALADVTMKDWAAGEGVTLGHLYAVLNGERESMRLTGKVDEFIARHEATGAAA